ncbi:MAG: substrate-binding domain-containing protein [Acidobacteriota bacterium]
MPSNTTFSLPRMARFLIVCALAWSLAAVPAAAQDGSGFVIIVHADNPTTSLEASKIQKMFLKKSKRWEDGEGVVAFDQDEKSPVRELFTEEIHGKSISAIKSYWQRMIFSGRDVPPEELASDQEVVARVGGERGGIGYVSAGTALGNQVKAITVED